MTRKEKILLAILACINFTHIMDFMIMMPLQEYLVPEFHISPKEFSFLVAAYALSAFLSSLTASFFVDRFDRKKVLLFAYMGFVAGTLACGLAHSYAFLLTSRLLTGLFGGLIGAQVLSIVGDTFPFEKRGRAMGILMTAFAFASVAGVPGGLYMATLSGWQTPFLFIGFLGILVIPLVWFLVPSMKSHISSESNGVFTAFSGIASSRSQQFALLMMFTLILSHFAIIPSIASFMEKNVGFTKHQVTLIYFIGGIASLISSPIIGKLSDIYGKQKIFSVFLLLTAIPVFVITNMPRIPFYYVLMISSLFFIFGGGRIIPAQALMTSVVPSQQRGGFMNISASIQQLGTGIASLLGGFIITKNKMEELQHYEYVGYVAIVISLFCLYFAGKIEPLTNEKKLITN